MRKTIFRLALITIAVLLVAVAPAAAQTETVVRVDPDYLPLFGVHRLFLAHFTGLTCTSRF